VVVRVVAAATRAEAEVEAEARAKAVAVVEAWVAVVEWTRQPRTIELISSTRTTNRRQTTDQIK